MPPCQLSVIDSRGMRYWVLVIFLSHSALFAQQRPLMSEHAETLEKDFMLLDIGMELLQNVVFPFSGLEGDLNRTGILGLRVGVADNVELQVGGVVQNVLGIENSFSAPNTPQLNFSGNSTNDFGDFTLATKVGLRNHGASGPAIAFRFGMELPNASNESGLGNDETNVFSSVLIEEIFGQLRVLGNAGIVILGDPVTAGSQDDLFTYGLAAIFKVNPRINLLINLHGREGPGGVGTEDRLILLMGTQIQAVGLYWDLALLRGLKKTDPDSGIVIGVSRKFKFRQR